MKKCPAGLYSIRIIHIPFKSRGDRKFIVPINIRFERQSGRRRFSSGCLFLALN
jgi:hypothetical protein